ncbi:MAG: SpoIIE family protein phosphatase [Anaerolineae bacterium]|nr:SpoIIE family protein phosphatase [Anaerolineae bacterium]
MNVPDPQADAASAASEAPTLARYYHAALDQIVEALREGTYCAVLGPRLSGKTHLLRYVERTLTAEPYSGRSLGWPCVYVDLHAIKAFTLQGFFAELTDVIRLRLAALTGRSLPGIDLGDAGSATFRAFLTDVVSSLDRDLVLIVEHLEALPTDLVQALLTSLRAAYMDQQTLDTRILVIVSGALSLASLTVGESSPFRGIARRILIGDLSRADSAELVADQLTAAGLIASKRAHRSLLRATSGDPYLIRRICEHCIEQTCIEQAHTEAATTGSPPRLRARMVHRVVRAFLHDEVYQYAPLQEAVRLVEEDPDLLHCILLLVAHGTVARSELPLPLSPDLDPLYLTGVVEQVGDGSYRIQNQIYRDFFTAHLHAGHVGHLLAITGRWDAAIDYLEAAIKEGNEQAQIDLLPSVINSMYAADDIGQAARFLARGLAAGFGVVEARVWHATPHEKVLRLVAHMGPSAGAEAPSSPRANPSTPRAWSATEMPLTADRLEARACRQGRALRGHEGPRHVWRVIPLLVPGLKPIGAVTLCDDVPSILSGLATRSAGQRERDRQLLGYLNQAARALHAVTTRRRELTLAGRVQTSLLPVRPPQVPGWQIAASLRPAREASGDFFDFIPLPGGRLGLVIADVADKGMAAALYMALSRTLIRTYATDYPERPDLTLRAANARILADTQADLFVTVFYGVLSPDTATLTYCNAGHHPPYLLNSRNGDAPQPLPGHGMALGIMHDTHWEHTTVTFPPGAALVLYTDGVLDAQNSTESRFGTQQMLDAALAGLRAGRNPQTDILNRLQQFVGDAPQFDDITLMTVVRDPT